MNQKDGECSSPSFFLPGGRIFLLPGIFSLLQTYNSISIEGVCGVKDAQGRPADLDLTEDMLRLLVINDRAGLYP